MKGLAFVLAAAMLFALGTTNGESHSATGEDLIGGVLEDGASCFVTEETDVELPIFCEDEIQAQESQFDIDHVTHVNSDTEYTEVMAKMRRVSENVYDVLDENGDVIATWTTREANGVTSRANWSINWTINPNGAMAYGSSEIQSYDGLVFDIDIAFSRTGSSKLGLLRRDSATIYWVFTSTNGFDGKLTCKDNYGKVSLIIRNDSSNAITYMGSYSI